MRDRNLFLRTDAVSDFVRLVSAMADDRVAVAGAEVEAISARTVTRNAAERSFDVVTVARHAAVVGSERALVVVCNTRQQERHSLERTPLHQRR